MEKSSPQSSPQNTPGQRPPFARRWELAAVALLLLGAGLWLALTLAGRSGAVAVVSVQSGGASQSFEVPLWRDDIIEVEAALPVTLEVKGGAIRFVSSHCPDHTCEGFGWLSDEGQWALCAPAGVLVSIAEE